MLTAEASFLRIVLIFGRQHNIRKHLQNVRAPQMLDKTTNIWGVF